MKLWVKIAWALILPVLALFCWYGWDSRTNRGLKFGYYGEFNTVSNALARLPNVRILKSGYNEDVSLEEFNFEIERDGRALEIFFSERNPIRRMSGTNLEKALSEMITEETAAHPPN
jgi:hypothetical protein